MIGGADSLKSNFNGCYDNALLLLRSIYSGNEVKNIKTGVLFLKTIFTVLSNERELKNKKKNGVFDF